MAACDNLYGNQKEWIQLRDFFYENYPRGLTYMYIKPKIHSDNTDDHVRICYIADIQYYLIEHCQLEGVKERLEGNFAVQSMILGKAHHE